MSENIRPLFVFADFITSLKVANIFVGVTKEDSVSNIKQIICEPHSITVTLSVPMAGGEDETLSLRWSSNSVRLLPNTCSKCEYSPQGLALRCNFEDSEEPKQFDKCINGLQRKKSRVFTRIRCRFCGNDFVERDGLRTPAITGVSMAALGLPKDFEWGNLTLSYFCHECGCSNGGNDDGTECMTFGPQKSQYFDCETYLVFHDEVFNKKQMLISNDNEVSCARCHKRIGECPAGFDGKSLKIYTDAITNDLYQNHSESKVFAEILSSCATSYNGKRCLACHETNLDECLLIVIMDANLRILRSSFTDTCAIFTNVFKVLYKHGHLHSMKSWSDDPSVKVIKMHKELFNKFVLMLTSSTLELPPAWRYADDYCIGYVSH